MPLTVSLDFVSFPRPGKIYVNGPLGTAGDDETLTDRLKSPPPFLPSLPPFPSDIWVDRYINTYRLSKIYYRHSLKCGFPQNGGLSIFATTDF